MMADLSLALSDPLALVQSIYAGSPSLEGIETRVSTQFHSLLSPRETLSQIPQWTGSGSFKPGSLVQFRAMVQDTGLGSEVYKALDREGKLVMFGQEDQSAGAGGGLEDYANLKERQSLFLVAVPAKTGWYNKKLSEGPAASLPGSLAGLSLESQASASALPNKFPIPTEPQIGCVAKVYGEAADALKTTDVLDFVGIVGETSIANGFDDLVDQSAESTASSVPALHVLFSVPVKNAGFEAALIPTALEELAALRAELVAYVAGGLGGDVDAAEWVVLALLARIHTRHTTGLALGSLSLNLALPRDFTTSLSTILSSILPTLSTLDLSIPILNNQLTRLGPRNRDENLESGRLQLAPGTTVLVDMRGIGEGKLEDAGVRNLRTLATTVAQQKLEYAFPFSSFELETDLPFVLVSEGKAIIPADCVVYVQPKAEFEAPATPDEAKLDQFRSLIATFKHSDFAIPPEMSEIIQADFVDRRQKSVGGEGMTQEDLLFRMTAARLLALSNGRTALDKESWLATAELDERRKDRIPAVLKA